MNDKFDKQYLRVCSKSGKHEEDQILLKPLLHILEFPGSEVIMTIIKNFNYWYKIPSETYRKIEDIILMILHAYILEDDVLDDSAVRRSNPTAHMIYGTALTINSAIYTYCITLEKASSLGNPQAFDIVLQTIMNVHRGQGMEIYNRDYLHCPSDDQYFEDNKRKACCLFLSGDQLLKLWSENKVDLTELCYRLGYYFQLRNDYICLWSEDYQDKKAVPYEDITEGKFSCPVAYAVNNSPKREEILQILRKRTTDIKLKKYCIKLIEECGGRSYTLAKANETYNSIFREIKALGGNPVLEEFFERTVKLRE